MTGETAICWLRRDLRLHDHASLYHALRSGLPVTCVFIFDQHILGKLEDRFDRRVTFIYRQLLHLDAMLRRYGSTLVVRYGTPAEVWKRLLSEFPVRAVYTNHDYEPAATGRDEEIRKLLEQAGVPFRTF